MSQYLHLGAGKIIFPVTPDNEPKHLAPLPAVCHEPGWINVDKFHTPGIDETIDLFAFPWIRSSCGLPFATDSIDAIYCSHLVEHIPHQVKLADRTPFGTRRHYEDLIEHLDGWFVFFYEAWRVLKPGGVIHVVVPWGNSKAGFQDPTHTRYVMPQTFGYLGEDDDDAPFSYRVPCKYEMSGFALKFTPSWADIMSKLDPEAMMSVALTYFDVVDTISISLTTIK